MKASIQIVLALAIGLAGASFPAFGARPKPPGEAVVEQMEEERLAGMMSLREDEAAFAAFRNEARAWREQPVKPALPEEVNRRRVLAEDAIRNKDYEDAIVHYERGLGLVPLWPEGQFNVALLYAELGEYGRALVHMKRYLELVPDAADARAAREKMYVWEERAGKPRSPGSGMSAKLKKELAALWREKPDPGRRFLIENATREGVATLPSGLQYRVVSAGQGKTPTFEDTVLIHYRGTLIDGSEFDSTHRRGKPAELPVKLLLKGMAEALLKMPVGSRWTLFVPPDLAYGERVVETRSGDATVVIGPNATLIYELELLEIR